MVSISVSVGRRDVEFHQMPTRTAFIIDTAWPPPLLEEWHRPLGHTRAAMGSSPHCNVIVVGALYWPMADDDAATTSAFYSLPPRQSRLALISLRFHARAGH